MTEHLDVTDTAALARDATDLLEHPAFDRCLRMLEALYVQQWRASDAVEVRERLHTGVSVLSDIRRQLYILRDRGLTAKRAAEKAT